MTIRLLSAVLIAGVHYSVNGNTLSLAPSLEADLVEQGKAVYVQPPALRTKLVDHADDHAAMALPQTVSTGSRDTDTALAATVLAPFTVHVPTKLNRVAGYVGTTQAAKLMEIAILDEARNILTTTGKREVPLAGPFEFAHPEITLPPGRYFYAMSCNGTTATFGYVYALGGWTATLALPIVSALAGIAPAATYPALTGLPAGLPSPSGFVDASTGIRVYGVDPATGYLWGVNPANQKLCYSSNAGASFTDAMPRPSFTAAGVADITFSGTKAYVLGQDATLAVSSNLTAGATWTDISCPTTTGLRHSVAVARPYGLCIWQDYVWQAEYTSTVQTASDPTDPSGPRILKYGPLSGSPSWSMHKEFSTAKHVHSFWTGSAGAASMYVTVGDNTGAYGADVGVWRISPDAAGSFSKWTSQAAPFNQYNAVDFIFSSGTPGVTDGLYLCGDYPTSTTPKPSHVMHSKTSGSAGSFNLEDQIFNETGISGETSRSIVQDATTKNIFWITQETTDPAVWCSPPPYTQAVRLGSISGSLYPTRSFVASGYLHIFDKRWSVAKFPWQA